MPAKLAICSSTNVRYTIVLNKMEFKEQTGLIWRGKVTFGDCYLNYVGPTGDNSLHRHFALQIVIGASIAVELADDARLAAPAIFIRPNVMHRLLPSESAELRLIEPYSNMGRAILRQLPSAAAGRLDNATQLLANSVAEDSILPVDPRLAAVIAKLSGPDALQRSIAEAARQCGLSPQRLRSISARELGMPLSKWRLWAALRRASESLAKGASIADAAHDGGFSDQAHFTRVMRATLGITPQMSKPTLTA